MGLSVPFYICFHWPHMITLHLPWVHWPQLLRLHLGTSGITIVRLYIVISWNHRHLYSFRWVTAFACGMFTPSLLTNKMIIVSNTVCTFFLLTSGSVPICLQSLTLTAKNKIVSLQILLDISWSYSSCS